MSSQARDLATQEQELIAEVSPARLMETTAAIARWERLSGTPDEAKAFDYIQEELDKAGLTTHRYSHPALVSWPEAAALTLRTASGELSLPAKTHAFAAPAPEGIEGELVDAGRGTAADLANVDLRGKIALIDGIIAPNHNLRVEQAGAIASIWIAGQRLHERALSPVWGTPTPETAGLLPKTPSVSVLATEGARIKEALAHGEVRARLTTRVYQAWHQLPIVTGDLAPSRPGPEADEFVLFSGHVDSWYYGAMDNGTANATQLEVARILAGHRDELRRGVRFAFWSGHSHARYAGSAWYADNFWHDLHEHCVAHVNIDSVGGMGASILSEGNTMEEVRAFVSDAVEPVAGERLAARRYGRAGDQSFWGHGIPAMLMSLSAQPAENVDPALAALHHQISGGESKSGGLGWWWHTPEDTIDKIDPALLERDARIYTLLVYRLATTKLLPFDYAAVVADLQQNAARLQAAAGQHFDLAPLVDSLDELRQGVERLAASLRARGGDVDDAQAARVNQALMDLGRALIPVDYTATGMFDHDLAVPTSPLPALQAAARLADLESDQSAYQFQRTRLTRERNRAVYGLRQANQAVARALAALGGER
ncbi:MAG TPA: M28 family peptidase [Nitrolancea sp.]|nr:M28 family peptidase [Nitrolancea sp.]